MAIGVIMLCKVSDCKRKSRSRGWCKKHYSRWKSNGSPYKTLTKPNGYWKAQFEEKVVIETNECVEWEGSHDRNKHGRVFFGGKSHRVGALALERHSVRKPEGKNLVLHLPIICHNPKCMNYRHLYWGDHNDNMADKIKDGTSMRGSLHPRAKLDEDTAKLIKNSKDSDLNLSNRFNVDRKVIWSIKKGKIWKHV